PYYRIEYSAHVAPNQQAPADRYLRGECCGQPICSIVGAETGLVLELVQRLRPSDAVPSNPTIVAGRNIVGVSRKGIATSDGEVLAATLFKPDLHRVIAGVSAEIRETIEFTIELRIGPQQIEQRDRWIAIA